MRATYVTICLLILSVGVATSVRSATKKAAAKTTDAQLIASAKKAAKSRTPAQRSASAKKAARTRARK